MQQNTIGYYRVIYIIIGALLFPLTQVRAHTNPMVYYVQDYGAKGDGKSLDTKSIQNAIDACHHAGGGVVQLNSGTFMSGTIFLKSGVRLHIEKGATLLGSTNARDYPDIGAQDPTKEERYNAGKSLIYSEGQHHISVSGQGVIDGNGAALADLNQVRAHIIHFKACHDIKINDVSLVNGAWWIQKYDTCNKLQIDGITVNSKENSDMNKPRYADTPGRNTDGCNIVDSRNVQLSNCHIFSGDDGIVLKSFSKDLGCHNVMISNCIISTNASGIKIGTESAGKFHDVLVNNCIVYDTRLGGIELMVVDGGSMERIVVTNISLNNILGAAIYVRLGNRGREYTHNKMPSVGSVKDILIQNIYGTKIGRYGSSITGIPSAPLKNITLENIDLTFTGGNAPLYFEGYPTKPVEERTIDNVPEEEKSYPRCDIFGKLPAYGFYIRHVEGIDLRNLKLRFEEEDTRSAIVADDVSNFVLDGLKAQISPHAPAVIQGRNMQTAAIVNCINLTPAKSFLHASGNKTQQIVLSSNIWKNLGTNLSTDNSFPISEIHEKK